MKLAVLGICFAIIGVVITVGQGCSPSGGGGGGGAGPVAEGLAPTTRIVENAFYIACSNCSGSGDKLFRLTNESTQPQIIGNVDSIVPNRRSTNEGNQTNIVVHNNLVYFPGSSSQGFGLFVYDPNQDEIANVNPKRITINGQNTTSVKGMVRIGDIIYFSTRTTNEGFELFKFDTTQSASNSNPTFVVDLAPGSADSNPDHLTAVDGKLIYSVTTASLGSEFAVYDPQSPLGSNNPLLIDVEFGSGSSSAKYFHRHLDKVYFQAFTSAYGYELFVYDPSMGLSAINPMMLANIASANNSSSFPTNFTSIGTKLYFSASVGTQTGLFVLDPNESVSAVNPKNVVNLSGSVNEQVTGLEAQGTTLYFKAVGPSPGLYSNPYVYDTTQPVSTTNPAVVSFNTNATSNPSNFIKVGSRVYFNAIDSSGKKYVYYFSESSPLVPTKVPDANTNGMDVSAADMVEWFQTITQ